MRAAVLTVLLLWGLSSTFLSVGLVYSEDSTPQEIESEEENEEVAIDLGELGADDFNPYVVERDFTWVLAPFVSILLVLVHLKKYKQKGRRR